MSYLHHLAERALGQSRPLRAQAPLRLLGEEALMQADEPTAPLPHQVARPEAMDAFRHAPHSNVAPRQPSGVLLDGNTDPAAPPAARRTATAGTHQPDVQPQTATTPIERLAMRATADGVSSAPMQQEPLPLLAMQPLHSATQTLAQPWPTAKQADETLAGVDEAQPDVPALRMPSPLLPCTKRQVNEPAPHFALRPSQVQPGARQPAGAVEETTEVHVTIGRIEVTAVQEAPTQKPAPRRRPAPMSLDEYIAGRQGGRA